MLYGGYYNEKWYDNEPSLFGAKFPGVYLLILSAPSSASFNIVSLNVSKDAAKN